ncbi:hypothetical protein Tsp_06986 [Trichinella spiralis]|uniref:hypothetical protein n=1 Tax=Trichinella spiralis TaxID=6334 RepID=UPI0001EFB263|nr:hypothetical protein Tsp_06986 [Trichinella spiralis]
MIHRRRAKIPPLLSVLHFSQSRRQQRESFGDVGDPGCEKATLVRLVQQNPRSMPLRKHQPEGLRPHRWQQDQTHAKILPVYDQKTTRFDCPLTVPLPDPYGTHQADTAQSRTHKLA